MIMKKIIFFFVLVIIMIISCTKENSFTYKDQKPKDSSFIYIDYKPMPKASIPGEIPKD